MQAISSRNEHRKMQDSLSFTFCWGETFDTAPFFEHLAKDVQFPLSSQ